MVLSALHTLSTRANLRQAHERQQEKALWDDPLARCNGCINGGGKIDLYKRKQKKRQSRSNS